MIEMARATRHLCGSKPLRRKSRRRKVLRRNPIHLKTKAKAIKATISFTTLIHWIPFQRVLLSSFPDKKVWIKRARLRPERAIPAQKIKAQASAPEKSPISTDNPQRQYRDLKQSKWWRYTGHFFSFLFFHPLVPKMVSPPYPDHEWTSVNLIRACHYFRFIFAYQRAMHP